MRKIKIQYMKQIGICLIACLLICCYGQLSFAADATAGLRSGAYLNWKQFDAAWASITLGNSGKTMGSIGCVVTSLAIVAVGTGLKSEASFDPGVLCQSLTYGSDGSLSWDSLPIAVPGLSRVFPYVYLTGFTKQQIADTIAQELNPNRQILLCVPGTNDHYVVVDSVSGSNIYIYDPGRSVGRSEVSSAYSYIEGYMVFSVDPSYKQYDLVGAINNYNPGNGGAQTGQLTAVASNNVVTVTGNVTGAANRLDLIIDKGVTVNWRANLSGKESFYLVQLEGDGIFNIPVEGSIVNNGGNTFIPIAIYIANDSTLSLNIIGGTVKASGESSYAINAAGEYAIINISSGLVEGENSAINSFSAINIFGGTVRSTDELGATIYSYGVINVSAGVVEQLGEAGVAIHSYGDAIISGTARVFSHLGRVIQTGGTVTVSGGTVTSDGGSSAINGGEDSKIIVSGGIIETTSWGISSIGEVEISGTALVSTNSTHTPAISIGFGPFDLKSKLTINGGTVQNKGSGPAIEIRDYGTVIVNGGTVLANTGYAIYSENSYGSGEKAALTINGGLVFAYGKTIKGENNVIYMPENNNAFTAPGGNGIVIAWDKPAGKPTYSAGTATNLEFLPSTATVIWDKVGNNNGIRYTNGINTGFLQLNVTIEAKSTLGDVTGDGTINMQDVLMIYQYFRGKITLSADQLQAADVNRDSIINMQDVLLVYQYFRGKITTFE